MRSNRLQSQSGHNMRVGPRTGHALDEAVGVGVRDQHVLQHAPRGAQVHGLGRREAAHAVARKGVHAGLVERAPRAHLALKLPAKTVQRFGFTA